MISLETSALDPSSSRIPNLSDPGLAFPGDRLLYQPKRLYPGGYCLGSHFLDHRRQVVEKKVTAKPEEALR